MPIYRRSDSCLPSGSLLLYSLHHRVNHRRQKTQRQIHSDCQMYLFCRLLRYHGEQIFRQIKVSLPSNIPKSTIEEVPVLKPGETTDIAMEIVLAGQQGKSIRCEVRSNNGTYTANFQPKALDILSTWVTSKADFEALRSRLGGFSAGTKDYSCSELQLSGSIADMEVIIIKRLRLKSNLTVVQGPGNGEIWLTAKSKRGAEASGDRILMSIAVQESVVKVKVNCDEPMHCTSVLSLPSKM